MRGLKLEEKKQIEGELQNLLETFQPKVRVVMFFYLPPETVTQEKVIYNEFWEMLASTPQIEIEEEVQRRFNLQKLECAKGGAKGNIVCPLVVVMGSHGNKHLRFLPK